MKNLAITCPPDSWPAGLDGCVCLGISEARGADALWLVFRGSDRTVTSVSGFLFEGVEVPPDITALEPAVVASGPRSLWVLIAEDRTAFYKAVAGGKLHIGGDFREFGRLARRLIRLTEQLELWTQLDAILDYVQSS